MKTELARRASLTAALEAFILAHPRVWLHANDLRPVGGDAWRSRLTEVRQRLADRGYAVVWNKKNGGASAYRLQPQPLGPPADPIREARLF